MYAAADRGVVDGGHPAGHPSRCRCLSERDLGPDAASPEWRCQFQHPGPLADPRPGHRADQCPLGPVETGSFSFTPLSESLEGVVHNR